MNYYLFYALIFLNYLLILTTFCVFAMIEYYHDQGEDKKFKKFFCIGIVLLMLSILFTFLLQS